MLRSALLVVLHLTLQLAPAAGRAAGDAPLWRSFRSEEGRFAVSMPGVPSVRRTSRETLVGTVHSVEYVLDRDAVELRVEHHDLPAIARLLRSESALLRRATGDFLAENAARETSSREIRLRGHAARRFDFESEGGRIVGEGLVALVAGRLYLAAVLRDPRSAFATASFLASLEFWE